MLLRKLINRNLKQPTTIASLNVQYVLFILSSTVNLQPSLPSMFNMFCLYSAQQWTYNHRFPQCSICFCLYSAQQWTYNHRFPQCSICFVYTQLNSEPTTIASLNVQYVLFILSSTVNAKTGFGIMVDIDLKNADVRDIWRKRKKDILMYIFVSCLNNLSAVLKLRIQKCWLKGVYTFNFFLTHTYKFKIICYPYKNVDFFYNHTRFNKGVVRRYIKPGTEGILKNHQTFPWPPKTMGICFKAP